MDSLGQAPFSGASQIPSRQQVSSLICELKIAARSRDLERGEQLHRSATAIGSDTDIYVSNTLIDMYAKCGRVAEARRVFDKITAPTIVSWNALILGYAENEEAGQALQLFAGIVNLSTISPDRATFLAALKACSRLATIEKATVFDRRSSKFVKSKSLETTMAIHMLCERAGWDRDKLVASALIDSYGKSKSMDLARKIFEKMELVDAVSWTSMIQGYADNDDGLCGLEFFEEFMVGSDGRATARMFVAALKSCTSLSVKENWKMIEGKVAKMVSLEKAMFLHREAARRNFHLDVFVASTLVDLYAKCGSIDLAREVFDKLDNRSRATNPVAWNALMLGCVELDHPKMALELFSSMPLLHRSRSTKKNEIFLAIVAAAKACSSLTAKELPAQMIANDETREVVTIKVESLATGMAIHAKARDLEVESHLFVATALIDMYSKCGSMVDAHRTFVNLEEAIEVEDPAPWNALILGYLDKGQLQASLSLLAAMRASSPWIMDARSYAIAIKVYAAAMDLERLRELHSEINHEHFMDPVLSSSLVDAYGRCGSMDEAESFFFSSSSRYTISWIALIAGYSRQGDAKRAIDFFQQMRDEGIDSNPVALQCVLSACAHTGQVEQAKNLLSSYLSSSPSMEHFHCTIDMLGRADRVEEAMALVESVRSSSNAVTWATVMDASRRSGKVDAAEAAFKELLKLEREGPGLSSAYELMASVYSRC